MQLSPSQIGSSHARVELLALRGERLLRVQVKTSRVIGGALELTPPG